MPKSQGYLLWLCRCLGVNPRPTLIQKVHQGNLAAYWPRALPENLFTKQSTWFACPLFICRLDNIQSLLRIHSDLCAGWFHNNEHSFWSACVLSTKHLFANVPLDICCTQTILFPQNTGGLLEPQIITLAMSGKKIPVQATNISSHQSIYYYHNFPSGHSSEWMKIGVFSPPPHFITHGRV